MQSLRNNMTGKLFFAILWVFVALSAFTFAGDWKVKQPYEIKFSGGKVHGKMKSLHADIHFDKNDLKSSKMTATVDARSLDAGFFIKTHHAKDAIDADNYPNITFTSTEIKKVAAGYEAVGKLTLKGVTKPMTIHFTFEDKGNEGVFKGSFTVVTKEFNITRWGSPDELTISLLVPVTQ